MVGKFPIKERCEETGEDKSEIFRSSGDNEGVRVWVRLYSVYQKDQKHVVTLFREGVWGGSHTEGSCSLVFLLRFLFHRNPSITIIIIISLDSWSS